MRTLATLLLLTLTCLAAPALAQDPTAPLTRDFALPGDNACPLDLPEPGPAGGWSDAEHWAWDQVCRGRWANMRYAGADGYDELACNPADIEDEVPAHRALRPEFFHVILTRAPWVAALAQPQVRITCALIPTELDLQSAEVSPVFALANSHLPFGTDLLGASFERTLSFQGSTFEGLFSADRLSVGGGLFLSGGASFQQVDLLGTQIDGDITAIDSTFEGNFNADGLSVGGSLHLSGGASFQEVRLIGAQIDGDISATGSTFEGPFNADGLSVGGGLFLSGGASFQEVRLIGAQIDGDIAAISSTFEGLFNADRLSVGGSLYLRGGASFEGVDLSGATINGSIQLYGSQFQGRLDLSSVQARELVLFRPGTIGEENTEGDDPIWGDGARLILRNTQVDAVQSRLASWHIGESWLRTDLSGFTYNRLEGFGGDDALTMLDADGEAIIEWLEGVNIGDTDYDPQPYEQLASVLEAEGMAAKANLVRYAKFRHRDLRQPGTLFQTYLLRPASRFVIGYGVYPFRALWWFVGIVAIGFAVAFKSRAVLLQPLYRKFWYSLENALPLVEFSEQHKHIDHENGLVEGWFHFQKVMGFLLATVLIGALSLLGG